MRLIPSFFSADHVVTIDDRGRYPDMPQGAKVIRVSPKTGCSASAVIAVVVLLVVIVATSFHIVPPGHRGVKVTLGKVDPSYLPEGLSWKLPLISEVKDM